MLKTTKINQFYGQSHILWDLDFEIKKGSCMCLMGRNGVGKTTFLKSILGLLPVKSGQISFMGEDLSRLSPEQRIRQGIAYVPQGREIFSQLTVEENLRTGLFARRDKLKTVPERIYELFPILKDMSRRRGGDLSGGQQQQLAFGRALASNPRLLILDEPTEGIQPNIVQQIGQVITKLNQEENLTMLLVEQKLPFARMVASDFAIMERGRVVSKGSISQLSDEIIQEYLSV